MARYIDADKVLYEMMCEMAGTGYQAMAMNVIKYAETADVVPKSEVDRLKEINAGLSLALLFECEPTKELLSELEKTVREKVAREIIEELKKVMIDEYRYPIIAELKKKYTESEDEE